MESARLNAAETGPPSSSINPKRLRQQPIAACEPLSRRAPRHSTADALPPAEARASKISGSKPSRANFSAAQMPAIPPPSTQTLPKFRPSLPPRARISARTARAAFLSLPGFLGLADISKPDAAMESSMFS